MRGFVAENHIQEGDLCLFQPITGAEATKFVVMVHLLDKAGRTDLISNHGNGQETSVDSVHISSSSLSASGFFASRNAAMQLIPCHTIFYS